MLVTSISCINYVLCTFLIINFIILKQYTDSNKKIIHDHRSRWFEQLFCRLFCSFYKQQWLSKISSALRRRGAGGSLKPAYGEVSRNQGNPRAIT